MKTKIDYKLWIHSIPEDLKKPLDKDSEYLEELSDLYQDLIDSPFLFPVWKIDEYDQFWISVEKFNEGEVEFHTIRIDCDTFTKKKTEEYEIDIEKNHSLTNHSR